MRALNIIALSAALYLLGGTACAYDVDEERTYTVTRLHLPESCRTRDQELCSRFSGFFASRFDRRAIELLSSREFASDDAAAFPMEDAMGVQEITVTMEHLGDSGVLTVGAEITSELLGERSHSFESMNLDEKSGRPVDFGDLFEDPALASMICARSFERAFLKDKTELYDAISAALELGPRNFVLKADGLEIIFAPGTARAGDRPARLHVRASELSAAGPKAAYFKNFGKNPQKN